MGTREPDAGPATDIHHPRWSVGLLLAVRYLLALVALLVIGVSSYVRIGLLLQDRAIVDHTYQVLGQFSRLTTQLGEVELEHREYLFLLDRPSLSAYRASGGAVFTAVEELTRLTADNPMHRTWIRELRPLLNERMSDLDRLIVVRREQGLQATAEALAADDHPQDEARIASLLTRMRQHERGLLEQRQLASTESADDTRALVVWMTGGGLVLAAVGWLWVRRSVVRPVQGVTEAAERVAAGDPDARAVVAGPKELARMAIAVNTSTQVMAEARDQAMAASRAKAAFLATMSHEIRTPLNAVIGMTGLLMDTRLSDEQRILVTTVRDSGDALLEIINDILDYSKIEAGELRLEDASFDIVECVESALALVALPAASKGLELVGRVDPACPRRLRGDPTRVRQILANLLSNAVKFTARGEVTVTVGTSPVGDDRLLLTMAVRDTGIGISAEQMELVFRSFHQVDTSTTRVYGGTGLGLAISRELTRAMGGTISVTSELGQGSTFTATALVHPCPTESDGGAAGSARLAGRTALVVDDNDTNRDVLRGQLASWGMHCVDAASAAEALTLVRAGTRFDVALLDMNMPDVDGAELGAELRRNPATESVPLVLLSSVTERLAPAHRETFDAQLTKPTRVETLRATLHRVLSERTPRTVATPSAPSRTPEHRLRVLLAEDNLVNQKVAQLMLARMGHVVDVVGNGTDAVTAVRSVRYDAVLMDLQMPELDGLAATREIRRTVAADHQPRIIAMTASVLIEDRAACDTVGMDDYLAKPVRLEELAAVLARVPARTAATPEAAARTRLAELLGGAPTDAERAAVGGLIDAFLAQTQDRTRLIVAALGRGDLVAIAVEAHSLRGAAANVGAVDLAAKAADLESAARHGITDDVVGAVGAVERARDAAAEVLGRLRAELVTGAQV